MNWKLLRQEQGEWRETGEVFAGSQAEVDAYLALRKTEDGWDYRAEPA